MLNIDYKELCNKLFGTTDVDKLIDISKKVHNSRRAGRKKKFTEEQIQQMKYMQQHGLTQQKIAEYFGTTRQTVSKYLRTEFNKSYTLQIDLMYRTSVCSTILVDFRNQKIKVINKTDDILHRAFGTNTNPSWDDFKTFLTDRCFPESRGDKKSLLKALQIDSYDPLQIVEQTHGKTYEDKLWMKFKNRSMAQYEAN